MDLTRFLVPAVVSLCVLSCSGGGGDSTGPAQTSNNPPTSNNPSPSATTVSVTNNSYSPSARTVPVGTTVQWSWSSCGGGPYGDDQCVFHSVTFDDGTGSELQSGGSYSRNFTKAGTYAYHCLSHGAAMSGTITVQ